MAKSSKILRLLEATLARGSFRIGQIRVHSDFSLHHIEDAPDDPALRVFTEPADARHIALYTADKTYRPLKSAPNLARGWLMRLKDPGELRLALDFFYPAALGLWEAYVRGELHPVHWRETVGRQTGMYRVVGLITDDQSRELIGTTCQHSTGCLRHILWSLEPGKPHALTVQSREELLGLYDSGEIPILCSEACNLLVAAGRPVVKAAQAAAKAAQTATAPSESPQPQPENTD